MRGGLSATGQGSRAREFFAIVQERTRAAGEGPEAADQRLQRLLEALPIQQDVEIALDRALQTSDGGNAGRQSVEIEEGGGLVVGGIRIPTRNDAPAPGEPAQG